MPLFRSLQLVLCSKLKVQRVVPLAKLIPRRPADPVDLAPADHRIARYDLLIPAHDVRVIFRREEGWFWYEVTSTTNGSKPVATGNGVPLCLGCHAAGNDFVLSKFPLR